MQAVGGLRLGRQGVLSARAFDHPLTPMQRRCKRALDVVVASLVLLLTMPTLAVAALVIWLDSEGSPLFSQERVGASGRRFRCYKLRTMSIGADSADDDHQAYVAALIRGQGEPQGGMYKIVNDPRITRVGHVLRRLSIDELPQLWNVLRGEMSLVGPRPPMVTEVELYDDRTWLRLQGAPGLTGPWQVGGRSLVGFDEMVTLDLGYWEQWSLGLDLKILLRTPLAVLSARGAA